MKITAIETEFASGRGLVVVMFFERLSNELTLKNVDGILK